MNFETPFLYPVLDDTRSVNLEHDVLETIRAGVRILQIRAKKLSNRETYNVIQSVLSSCINAGVSLIVNDRVDVCLVSGASGVHLGQDDFPVEEARKLLPDAIIGLSTHNIEQVRAANDLPVDYLSIGPIFPTTSKANPDPVVGIPLLQKARIITNKPIVCIGGIQATNIPHLIDEGANGIALIGEIYKDNDISNNTKRLLELVRRGGPGGRPD
jgi:thiamine-phosphate pyrophosphorylase